MTVVQYAATAKKPYRHHRRGRKTVLSVPVWGDLSNPPASSIMVNRQGVEWGALVTVSINKGPTTYGILQPLNARERQLVSMSDDPIIVVTPAGWVDPQTGKVQRGSQRRIIRLHGTRTRNITVH